MRKMLPDLITSVADRFKYSGSALRCEPVRPASIFNSSKVTDHHAIIPTKTMAVSDFRELSLGKMAVLQLISARLLCAAAEDYRYAESTVKSRCGVEEFTRKGRTDLQLGWKAIWQHFYPDKKMDEDSIGQKVYLFDDTIYNNIAMGRQNVTYDEVVEAAKKARCYEFIMRLPYGFDTRVGEGGASLSGGEKQRISIARCILKDAPIIILDEATASVDADNEYYIQEAMSELCKDKTVLVIAHRLNTIRSADKIIVLEKGKVVEEGNHETLMQVNGRYRSSFALQKQMNGWNNSKEATA